MWPFSKQKELEEAVDKVGNKIDELIQERDKYKSLAETYEQRLLSIEANCSQSDCVIDFNAINVFSIERNTNDNFPCTIVGYTLKSDTSEQVREWYLYCTDQRHQELIDSFRAFIVQRDKIVQSMQSVI